MARRQLLAARAAAVPWARAECCVLHATSRVANAAEGAVSAADAGDVSAAADDGVVYWAATRVDLWRYLAEVGDTLQDAKLGAAFRHAAFAVAEALHAFGVDVGGGVRGNVKGGVRGDVEGVQPQRPSVLAGRVVAFDRAALAVAVAAAQAHVANALLGRARFCVAARDVVWAAQELATATTGEQSTSAGALAASAWATLRGYLDAQDCEPLALWEAPALRAMLPFAEAWHVVALRPAVRFDRLCADVPLPEVPAFDPAYLLGSYDELAGMEAYAASLPAGSESVGAVAQWLAVARHWRSGPQRAYACVAASVDLRVARAPLLDAWHARVAACGCAAGRSAGGSPGGPSACEQNHDAQTPVPVLAILREHAACPEPTVCVPLRQALVQLERAATTTQCEAIALRQQLFSETRASWWDIAGVTLWAPLARAAQWLAEMVGQCGTHDAALARAVSAAAADGTGSVRTGLHRAAARAAQWITVDELRWLAAAPPWRNLFEACAAYARGAQATPPGLGAEGLRFAGATEMRKLAVLRAVVGAASPHELDVPASPAAPPALAASPAPGRTGARMNGDLVGPSSPQGADAVDLVPTPAAAQDDLARLFDVLAALMTEAAPVRPLRLRWLHREVALTACAELMVAEVP